MKSKIKSIIESSIDLKTKVLNDAELNETIQNIIDQIIHCYENGGKVLFCGNGGSAADAQHLAAELSGRFYFDRHPLFAEALHVNTSYVTAVANDYGFDEVFARLVMAMGSKDDILIGLSTSGNSNNILRAFDEAITLGMITVGFTGESGGKLKENVRTCSIFLLQTRPGFRKFILCWGILSANLLKQSCLKISFLMITKEAIVLAGGLGTRLRGVLSGIPKCMAPINGKPFLEYVFEYLIKQGISKVILSVGYRKDQIINYFDDRYCPLKIEYAIENQPLGTGGAVKLALEYCSQDIVFVLNGDTYFIPDLQSVEKLHFQSKADITIAVKHLAKTGRYGLVQTDSDGRITEFREKDPLSGNGWINGGIYLLKKQVFESFPEGKFSLENEVFKETCSRLKMIAFHTEADFLDIGIPEDYTKAQTMIKTPENK